jgi:hypothetical protein
MPRAFPTSARRVTNPIRGGGRVSKNMPFRYFTPETKKLIIAAVKAGEFATSAARKARISENTLRHWLVLGEDAVTRREAGEELNAIDTEFAEFFLDVYAAEGHDEGEAVKEIRDAGRAGNWVASVTFLERRYSQRWRKTETQQHVGPGGGPIQHEHVQLDNGDAKIAEVLDILRGAGVLPEGIKGLPAPSDA